jgi:rod shape-determining protein MreC
VHLNFKRPHYIALGAVVLLTVVFLKLPSRTASQLKLAISGLFLPLFGLAGSANSLTEKAGNAVVPRAELVKELERLRRENNELRLRLTQTEETARENARLRQSLGAPRQFPWRVKMARVVARDPANWWRTIKIDVGLRQGVTTNNPVLSPEGFLVGRVSEVSYTQARVVLIGDPDCRVSVMIEETRDAGVIAPASSSPLDNIIVDLSYLSRNSTLRAGQRVVTSGLGGVFPKGIMVGQIVDFRNIGFGLYNEARVKLAARMNALEEVWVVLP